MMDKSTIQCSYVLHNMNSAIRDIKANTDGKWTDVTDSIYYLCDDIMNWYTPNIQDLKELLSYNFTDKEMECMFDNEEDYDD